MPSTVSIKLSQRLAKLGVDAPSEWYWVLPTDTHPEGDYDLVSADDGWAHGSTPMDSPDLDPCHAYTTDELLEMLPAHTMVMKLKGYRTNRERIGWYSVRNQTARDNGKLRPFIDKSLPECCGLMLAYLKENKIL